jgi:competence protein ComEC
MVEIVFWDVQRGSASYIKTPNNRHILVDLGTGSYSNEADFSPVLHLKRKYGVTKADMVFITHPHRDHIDDIANLDEISPITIWQPDLEDQDIRDANRVEDQAKVNKYLEISQRFNTDAAPVNNLSAPANWGGVEFNIFATSNCAVTNMNNRSGVLLLKYGVFKVLFSGDNESCSWKELLAQPGFRTAVKGTQILLAPHHGRESGYYPDLFKQFKPKLTVISDGQFCDASATSRYSAVSTGWSINYPDGTSETRNCVTTRTDGVIVLTLWMENGQSYYNVKVTNGYAKAKAANG